SPRSGVPADRSSSVGWRRKPGGKRRAQIEARFSGHKNARKPRLLPNAFIERMLGTRPQARAIPNLASEIIQRFLEPFLELDSRFPSQQCPRLGNIGAAARRIVHRQIDKA